VTREAATMVLMDDNFATIVRAVEEGRVIFDNIVKFVRFQLSTNIGAILTVLAATLMGMPAPFTAIQLLWINIIMDGPPAMTLGVEPARPGIMQAEPRRQDAQILTLRRLAPRTLRRDHDGRHALAVSGCLGHPRQAYALTLAFTTFVLFQFFNVFNARNEHGSAFNGSSSPTEALVGAWRRACTSGPRRALATGPGDLRDHASACRGLAQGGARRLQRALARGDQEGALRLIGRVKGVSGVRA
jgi:magnesium-transporting ATPase (P-type)